MPQTTLLVYRDKSGESPLISWLEELEESDTKSLAKCLERILQLERSGHELRRPAADILRDKIYELRAKRGRVYYRILYFFCAGERNVACLTHGFTKECAVPDTEIEYAIDAKELVHNNRARYTMEWEL
ncbi:MAG: type II toxin-antitoxin system RelE/ParE family toxin [Gemmataceae bacterium]|nr:type II toxin-antitoxin system RelE/ParE family toxin [Gemmataceae bacterium]